MKKNKVFSLLGFASKSGNIASGDNTVLNEIRKGSVYLVIIAGDASANTKKKFTDKSNSYGIESIIFSNSQELSRAIGKQNRTVIAIKEDNFAKKIKELLGGGPFVEDESI